MTTASRTPALSQASSRFWLLSERAASETEVTYGAPAWSTRSVAAAGGGAAAAGAAEATVAAAG